LLFLSFHLFLAFFPSARSTLFHPHFALWQCDSNNRECGPHRPSSVWLELSVASQWVYRRCNNSFSSSCWHLWLWYISHRNSRSREIFAWVVTTLEFLPSAPESCISLFLSNNALCEAWYANIWDVLHRLYQQTVWLIQTCHGFVVSFLSVWWVIMSTRVPSQ
jgi:hypothetical protein